MQMIAILNFGAFTLSALLIAAAHWFPWPMVFGRKLRRLEAYTAGTLAIFIASNRRNLAGISQIDAIDTLLFSGCHWPALAAQRWQPGALTPQFPPTTIHEGQNRPCRTQND